MSIRRKVLIALLALTVLGLAADLAYLNGIIDRRSQRGLLRIPSYIYGKPVEVRKGGNINGDRIFRYLALLGYDQREGPPESGEFERDDGSLRVNIRDFDDQGTLHKGFPARIEFDEESGEITRVSARGISLDTVVLGLPEIGRITDVKREIREYLAIEDMSPYLVQTTLAAEDRRFFSHHGIDYRALLRVLIKDISTMSLKQGGSTITQQLARNFFLTSKKTLSRKFQETLIALLLEIKFSKEKILELYLNQVYLGQRGSEGIYGVEEASRFYFGKSAKTLNLAESSLIASLIKSPHYYSPVRHPDRVMGRMKYILKGMEKMGFLSREERLNSLVNLPEVIFTGLEKSSSGYFTDSVMELLSEKLEENDVFYGGYRIYTTLDPLLQVVAYKALRESLAETENRFRLEKKLQGAVVIIDNRDGGVSALVGGRDYGESQFNRALRAKRQVGSLFKPFVVLTAIKNGSEGKPVTLATRVDATGKSIDTEKGVWLPKNFNDKKYDDVTVRNILTKSINTGAVALGMEAGLDNIIRTCSSLGIGEGLKPYPSMILGSFTHTPIEMGYAYSVFPSGGLKHPVRIVKSVMKKGEKVLSFPSFALKVIKPEEAYLINYALHGTVEEGTARGLKQSVEGYLSGKTGTTDDGRDSWFVGMTVDYTIVVWVGFDDASPSRLTGATGALPVCRKILEKIYRKKPPPAPAAPEGIIFMKVDADSGLLARAGCEKVIDEAFIKGTEPDSYCDLHPGGAGEGIGDTIMEMLEDLFREKEKN